MSNKTIKLEKAKIEKIMANFDFEKDSPFYKFELNNAIKAKEFGLTWKEIEQMIEDRISDHETLR